MRLWLQTFTLFLMGGTSWAVPFVLPPNESQDLWNPALVLAGQISLSFDETIGNGPFVELEYTVHPGTWRLRVLDQNNRLHEVEIAAPRSQQEREDAVALSASLLHTSKSSWGSFPQLAPIESIKINVEQKNKEPVNKPAIKETEPKPIEPIVVEEPKSEEPKSEEPKSEEPKTEEPKSEEPKSEKPKTEKPKTEKPKTAILEKGTSWNVWGAIEGGVKNEFGSGLLHTTSGQITISAGLTSNNYWIGAGAVVSGNSYLVTNTDGICENSSCLMTKTDVFTGIWKENSRTISPHYGLRIGLSIREISPALQTSPPPIPTIGAEIGIGLELGLVKFIPLLRLQQDLWCGEIESQKLCSTTLELALSSKLTNKR